jgi:type I restriction enzyme S subunit
MMMYQTDPQKLRSDYLVFAIYSEQVQQRLLELAGGSTVGHIRVGDIRNLSIPHPKDVDEQEKIAATLTRAEAVIACLTSNVKKLSMTKAGLMHDLLTGTVRVKV